MANWSPSQDDITRVFSEQNPWHKNPEIPDSLAPPMQRALAKILWKRLLSENIVRYQVILGPRRVGKTTVLYQTVKQLLSHGISPISIWWLRLDHPLLLGVNLGKLVQMVVDTTQATADSPVYLMLDEIVYAENWAAWLKTFYDDRWPVRIAATSSATAALKELHAESGVGRWEEQYLPPFLFSEFLDLLGVEYEAPQGASLPEQIKNLKPIPAASRSTIELHRDMFLIVGGFPELLKTLLTIPPASFEDLLLNSQQVLRSDAVERAVYKDIPQSFGVDDPMMLERLLYVLAAQVAGLLAPGNICSELSISQPTFDKYLNYLEKAFLVFTLNNYSGRELSVQKRGRKLYFLDGAIRNSALHRGLAPLRDSTEMGYLLENLVASALKTVAVHNGLRLFHWRENKNEVDLVLDHPEQPLAFEIASSSNHGKNGMKALVNKHKRFETGCYLVFPEANVVQPENSDDGIGRLPLDAFIILLGKNAENALKAKMLEPSGKADR